MPAKSAVATLAETEEVGKVSFHIRGKLYEIEEAEAEAYEKDADAATDEDEGTVDLRMLTKLLTLRCVKVDGQPIDPATWAKEKFPVVNRVQQAVRDLHFVAVKTDEEIAAEKKTAADGEKKREAAVQPPNS